MATGRRALLIGGIALLVLVALALTTGGDGERAPDPPAATPAATATSEPLDPTPAPSPAPTEASLVMWARGGLERDAADRIGELDDVLATAFVRSATLGLVATRDATGTTVEEWDDGFRVPVAAAAVSPAELAATSDGTRAPELLELSAGEVLLSETSARLRGIGVGGTIDLVNLPGLEVAGVVPDGTARRAEIILHAADADRAGIDADGSIVVRYRTGPGGSDAASMETAIRGSLPDDPPVRIVAGGGTYRAPLVLPLLEVKERFGELAFRPRAGTRDVDADAGFVREHIVSAEVPLLGTVRCHRDIVEDLRRALADIVDAGLTDAIDPSQYGGCYHPRLISADRDGLSRHSWGIAIDVNVDLSVPGLGPPPPPEVIAAFARHGFRWGGDFLQPDNHHFEWVGAAARQRD